MPADPDGYPAIQFLLLLLLGILGALYAAGEAFLRNVNESKLRKESESGNPGARRIARILERDGEIFSSLQLGLMLTAALTTAYSVESFAPAAAGGWFYALPESAAGALGFLSVALLTLLVFFTCCDFIPKKLVAHRAGGMGYGSSPLLWLLHGLALPFLLLFSGLSNLFLRLFGFDPKSLRDTVTEEEIMMLVGESEEKGVIQETEKDMIENILDFNDTTVSEVMTHRTEISALPDTATVEEMVALSVEDGFSRIPVYHEDIDSIIGILYAKDLIPYVGKQVPEFISIRNLIRPAYFIPETKKCSQLFSELTEKKVQIAIIVDEYGGTSGLITLEDLVESILGNIQDEYDNEEEDITKVSEYEFTVDGGTSVDEVSDLAGVELPEGDYDTIAGLVTERLGRILREDEHPTIEEMGLTITVLEVEDQRISKLLIKKERPAETAL